MLAPRCAREPIDPPPGDSGSGGVGMGPLCRAEWPARTSLAAARRLAPMQALLWGKDYVDLGEVAVSAVDARTAVAITRGRHKKSYQYTHPNEDAAVAVVGRRATLLA